MSARTFLAASVIAMAVAAPAAEAMPPEEEGILNARDAGIYVDPAMEDAMAEAPIGSCINDPSLLRCPDVTAIVYAPEFFDIPEAQRPVMAIASGKRGKRAKRTRARAAAYNCGVKLVNDSPFRAAGYEQMNSQNLCFEPITDLDVYQALDKYYNYQWNTMANKWNYPTNPNQYPWKGSLTYECASLTVNRHWRARVNAYAEYKGVWYGGFAKAENFNYCG